MSGSHRRPRAWELDARARPHRPGDWEGATDAWEDPAQAWDEATTAAWAESSGGWHRAVPAGYEHPAPPRQGAVPAPRPAPETWRNRPDRAVLWERPPGSGEHPPGGAAPGSPPGPWDATTVRHRRPAAPGGAGHGRHQAPAWGQPAQAAWDSSPGTWYRPEQQAPAPRDWREPPSRRPYAQPAALERRYQEPPYPGPVGFDPAGFEPAALAPRVDEPDWAWQPRRSRSLLRRRRLPPRAPQPRPRSQRHPWGTIISLTVGLTVAVYGLVLFGYNHPGDLALPTPTGHVAAFTVSSQHGHYIGMATRYPFQLRVPTFAHDVLGGRKPGIVEYYQGFSTAFPFRADIAWYLTGQKILPLIQINPWHVNLARIVSGAYDRYLKAYAVAVHKFGAPVGISFAHEMNGWWYPWGRQLTKSGRIAGTSPATFVATWRHIHDVFTRAGATNVIWVWTISRDANRPGWPEMNVWWPGRQYVNWIGMDGYYRRWDESFHSLFAKSLAFLRTFTNKPVLIAETAVRPSNPDYVQQIANLFAGVRQTPNLLGFVWFDLNAQKTRIAWNIDQNKAAIAIFRKAMKDSGVSRHRVLSPSRPASGTSAQG